MTVDKPLEDMTPEELSEAEPILFPKPLEKLTAVELTQKVDDALSNLHHWPSGFNYDDHLLFTELKNRFENLTKEGK